MARAAQPAPFPLDHFLVDPYLREIDRDAVATGANDDALDWYFRPVGKANRSANICSDFGEPCPGPGGDVAQSPLGTVHDLESAAAAQKDRALSRRVLHALEAAPFHAGSSHAHQATPAEADAPGDLARLISFSAV
jgi:hypothetical protein